MPRLPIDYQKTLIYKIICRDLSIKDVYVGHTTNFSNRKRGHTVSCEFESNPLYHLRLYQFIRSNGGWANWDMLEVEKFPCADNNEARTRERYWIEALGANLNMVSRPIVCRDELLNSKKEWYYNNRQKVLDRAKEPIVCECGLTITAYHLKRHITRAVHRKRMEERGTNTQL